MKHFDILLNDSYKHPKKINRCDYAVISKKNSWYKPNENNSGRIIDFDDTEKKYHTDKWCKNHYDSVIKLYDKNMEYFNSLDKIEFNKILNHVNKKWNFREIERINECKGIKGVYILVLDDFCQMYVGVSMAKEGIKGRINSHWRTQVPFDRLPKDAGKFDYTKEKILSNKLKIDSFQVLDTSRIFILENDNPFEIENEIIKDVSFEFILNRAEGGRTPWTEEIIRQKKVKDKLYHNICVEDPKGYFLIFPEKKYKLKSKNTKTIALESENLIREIIGLTPQKSNFLWDIAGGAEAWGNLIRFNYSKMDHSITFFPLKKELTKEDKSKGILQWFYSSSDNKKYKDILKNKGLHGSCVIRYFQ